MTGNNGPSPDWTDERLTNYIRHWGVEHSKCGRDGFAANRINQRHIFPAGDILSKRGSASLRKLLPLPQDSNPNVRFAAASIAYDTDPQACRATLEELMKTLDLAGILAWSLVSLKEGPDAVPNPGTLWGIKE